MKKKTGQEVRLESWAHDSPGILSEPGNETGICPESMRHPHLLLLSAPQPVALADRDVSCGGDPQQTQDPLGLVVSLEKLNSGLSVPLGTDVDDTGEPQG